MASANGATPAAGTSNAAPSVQNIDIRVPKNESKKLAIMRFNGSMSVDFVKWTHVKMERENNQVQFKGFNEDMPKFGAGSEYGREQREEARRKKYGIISKKYKPEDQPWTLQHGGKAGKKFRGVRDGGVAENASYYVFTQAPDGVFEAFPVQEQYSFQAIHNYKALSYEEAEEEFSSRNRTFNFFNVMVRKRMKKEEDGEEDDDEEGGNKAKNKGKKKKNTKDTRFGDDDDMMQSSEESSDEDGNGDDDDADEKKKKKDKGKKFVKPKKKRKQGSDDEALEDSDDGDGEGRELDYISSDDESDPDLDTKDELKGVAEEDALRKLLNSDEEDEDEEKQEDDDKDDKEDEDAEDPSGEKIKEEKEQKKKKKDKNKNKDKKPRKEEYGSSSDSPGESSDSEIEKAKPSPKTKSSSANSSRSATPTKPFQVETTSDSKRKGLAEAVLAQANKKPRMDINAASSSMNASAAASAAASNANEGVNEESVRRYLSRKPMTTTELLQKFKNKRTGLTSEQLVPHIAQILKKINPVKQTIKGKMYLSIKG